MWKRSHGISEADVSRNSTFESGGSLHGCQIIDQVCGKEVKDGDKVLHSDYHGNEVHRNADTSKGRKVHTDHYEKGYYTAAEALAR